MPGRRSATGALSNAVKVVDGFHGLAAGFVIIMLPAFEGVAHVAGRSPIDGRESASEWAVRILPCGDKRSAVAGFVHPGGKLSPAAPGSRLAIRAENVLNAAKLRA